MTKDRRSRWESDLAAPGNVEIRDLLRRRARQTSRTLRWNRNVLLLTYVVLAATVFVALRVDSALFVAMIAVPGLAIVWVFSAVQAKRLEKRILEEDVCTYQNILEESRKSQAEDARSGAPALSQSILSDREMQVLMQIAAGCSNKQAALVLSISEQTVKNHLKHIFEKLQVSDRTSAVLVAVRSGWIEADGHRAERIS